MPLFFATATDAQLVLLVNIACPNKIKKVLKAHEPFMSMIYQARGQKVDHALCNGFGFGGVNAALILSKVPQE